MNSDSFLKKTYFILGELPCDKLLISQLNEVDFIGFFEIVDTPASSQNKLTNEIVVSPSYIVNWYFDVDLDLNIILLGDQGKITSVEINGTNSNQLLDMGIFLPHLEFRI